jgi:hypothetical protein
MVDATHYAARDTDELTIDAPDGDPMKGTDGGKVVVVIFGPGSEQAEAVKAAQNKRNMELMKRAGGKLDLSPEELRKQRIARLVGRTAEIRNLGHPGAASTSTADVATAIYSDRTIGFIAEQVEQAMDDWSRFTKRSATS